MHGVTTVLFLLAAVSAMAIAARRSRLPYPTVMVIGGLIIGFLPHLPRVQLEPDIFFNLFLPPLLYASAWTTSWREFRANLRPISLLAIGFVIFTTVAIAALAHGFVPGMPWAAAFALGAIVSPPDAVAAAAVAGQLGLPERIVAILEGESLVNDAAALTLYRFALAAAVTGAFSLHIALIAGVLSVIGGIGAGLLLGWCVVQLHQRMEDPLVETVMTLLAPYAAFIAVDELRGSGVLAVVTMGLYVSRRGSRIFSPVTRLHAESVWETVVFMLNGLVFVILGMQLPQVMQAMHDSGESTSEALVWAVALCSVLVLVRIVWVFPAAYLPRILFRSIREREEDTEWKGVLTVAYIGMRGATSLAAALAIPLALDSGEPFPRRSLIIFLTFAAIVATLVLQSLSLPPLIHWLKLPKDEQANRCEEWEARVRAAQAALKRIEELQAVSVDGAAHGNTQGNSGAGAHGARHDGPTLARLKTLYEDRVARMNEAMNQEETGRCARAADLEWSTYRIVLTAERKALVGLRDTNVIGDAVMRQIERDLDLEESRVIAAESRIAAFG